MTAFSWMMLVRRSLTGWKWLLLLLISAACGPGAFATEEEQGRMPCLTIGEILVQSGRIMDALGIAPVWKDLEFDVGDQYGSGSEYGSNPDPIPIQGFNDQKFEKKLQLKFIFYFFFIKNCNLPIPRPP